MTKTKRTMLQVASVWILVGGSMIAQEVATPSVVNVAHLDLRLAGLELQTNASAGAAKDELFAGAEKFAQGASEVTEINLDPTTIGLVGDGRGRTADEARKIKFMVIHTYKYDKPGMYRVEELEAYRKKLADGSWNCAIRVRSASGSTDICSRTAADHETNEMVILTAQPQKLTFIHMSGKMSLEELNDMSGSANSLRSQKFLPNPPGTTLYMTAPGKTILVTPNLPKRQGDPKLKAAPEPPAQSIPPAQ